MTTHACVNGYGRITISGTLDFRNLPLTRTKSRSLQMEHCNFTPPPPPSSRTTRFFKPLFFPTVLWTKLKLVPGVNLLIDSFGKVMCTETKTASPYLFLLTWLLIRLRSWPTLCLNTLKREAVKRKDLAGLVHWKKGFYFVCFKEFLLSLKYDTIVSLVHLLTGGRCKLKLASFLLDSFFRLPTCEFGFVYPKSVFGILHVNKKLEELKTELGDLL